MAYKALFGEPSVAIPEQNWRGNCNFQTGFTSFQITSESHIPSGANTISVGGWLVNCVYLGEVRAGKVSTFTRRALLLPMSCIESAEHVIRCKARGRHMDWDPKRSDAEAPATPHVRASFGAETRNISTQEVEGDGSYGNFFNHADIGINDGVILAYNARAKRSAGVWTCHAAAVVAKKECGTALILIDIYANDAQTETPKSANWTLSYVTSMQAFHAHYASSLGGNNLFALGKLSPIP